MGESINEGTILEWRKKVGESIELDEILLEIGTDKVDSEIPSSAAGTLMEILAEPNDVIAVGKVIAKINTDVSDTTVVTNPIIETEGKKQTSTVSTAKSEPKVSMNEGPSISTPTVEKAKKFYSPVVMKIASDKGIA